MRRGQRTVMVLVAATLLAGAANDGQAQNQPQLPQGFSEAQSALEAALEALNATAAGAWFADNAVVDFGGEIYTGKQTIVGNWLPGVLSGLHSLRFGESTFAVTGEEVTESTQHFVENQEGTQTGNHRVLWRKIDGQWRVSRLDVFPG
jgi:hypothetical protein